MAGQFKTTAEEMSAFANRIGEVNAQVQGEIGRLNSLVDSIAQGWQARLRPRTSRCSRGSTRTRTR